MPVQAGLNPVEGKSDIWGLDAVPGRDFNRLLASERCGPPTCRQLGVLRRPIGIGWFVWFWTTAPQYAFCRNVAQSPCLPGCNQCGGTTRRQVAAIVADVFRIDLNR